MSEFPLISVVVPTLNQARFIEQTLASIAGQNWPRTELIVIDGGSTDGTREIVQRYPTAQLVSEADRGQADAINKGMRLAKGDILAWLNSDDYYLPLAFSRAVAVLGDITQPRLVYGGCLLLYEAANSAKLARPHPFDARELAYHDYIHQPATFWTRALWDKTGELNLDFHYVLDWDFWLRASQNGELLALDECLAVYRFHDAHKTGGNSAKRIQEMVAFVDRHGDAEARAAFHAVADRLPGMARSWDRWGRNSRYRWHKLRHLDLYTRHPERLVNLALWQLHV
jgi:glycosyltransferase involved in cell wall biosynthesis